MYDIPEYDTQKYYVPDDDSGAYDHSSIMKKNSL